MTRFNYFNYAVVIPPSSTDLDWGRRLQEQAKEFLAWKFEQHLHSRCDGYATPTLRQSRAGRQRRRPPCGWCQTLSEVAPTDQPFVALRCYVTLSRSGEWRNNSDAQTLYLSLPPERQREVDKLSCRRGQRSPKTLLEIIERDQEQFRSIVEDKGSGSITDAFEKVYAAYRSHASLLLGKLTLLGQLEKRPSLRRLVRMLKERRERSQAGRGPKMWVVRDWQTSPRPLFRRQQSIFATGEARGAAGGGVST